jgi:hypothetical protein
MAALAPMPSASVSAMVIHKVGTRDRERKAILKSWRKEFIMKRIELLLIVEVASSDKILRHTFC